MKSRVRRARVTSFATIEFTAAEVRDIEEAARECGTWRSGEGAHFGKYTLLSNVASILSVPRARTEWNKHRGASLTFDELGQEQRRRLAAKMQNRLMRGVSETVRSKRTRRAKGRKV
jgi:hypothetical protein